MREESAVPPLPSWGRLKPSPLPPNPSQVQPPIVADWGATGNCALLCNRCGSGSCRGPATVVAAGERGGAGGAGYVRRGETRPGARDKFQERKNGRRCGFERGGREEL
eukprot:356886-Chlamydomonas_euryale.AAC.1